MFVFPPSIRKIKAAAGLIEQALTQAGIETAALDARLLIEHVCLIDHAGFIASGDKELSDDQLSSLAALARRRMNREPVARIIGKAEFWSLEFSISAETLDPRPDTETLVELALEMIDARRDAPLRLLDLGTGSGCILLSLLTELPNAVGVGVDLSQAALETARQNAMALGLDRRTQFLKSDWFSSLNGHFDVIVSNPPYIPQAEIDTLEPEVALFEPRAALDGGVDGLAPYRLIFDKARSYLAANGVVLLEFGQDQETDIIEIMNHSPMKEQKCRFQLKADLQGINRVIGIEI